MRILFDVMNSSQVHTLRPIISYLADKHDIHIIARDLGETFGLLDSYNLDYTSYGSHAGKSQYEKQLHAIAMILGLIFFAPKYDYSI